MKLLLPFEIEKLRKPYLDKCSNTLSRYINKYGEEEGKKIFHNGVNKRIETLLERYGTKTITTYVSKESLRFLIKLYKKIRKSGVQKTDIVWGISGNKEFVLTVKKNLCSREEKNSGLKFIIIKFLFR